MSRAIRCSWLLAVIAITISIAAISTVAKTTSKKVEGVAGTYMEARTCQVYTGPCFANGEVGLGGKNAVMSWKIESGEQDGVNLKGLGVMMVVRSSDTLAFEGLDDATEIKSMIVVDQDASKKQRDALVKFAKSHSGKAGKHVSTVRSAPFEMKLDTVELKGELNVGKFVQLKSRKARPGDCICSNESAYYPPLAKLSGCAPGVTIEGNVKARSLGSTWSIPDSRTSYLGTFRYQ